MNPTFAATIEQVNQTTSRATVRTHTLLVDRSVAKGGFDLGPAGGEYMLVSLGGCFTSHLLAAIRAREAPVTNVRVVVTGTLAGVPERFATFTMDVSAESEDSELARKLIRIAGRACQVVNTLGQVAPIVITYQGSPIELNEAAAVRSSSHRRDDAR
jgi:putative redox protein